jgi:hypothetical protein
MERRRKVRLRAVLLVVALYCLVALPVGYVCAEGWLSCGHLSRRRPAPLRATRSAAMLYVADNPRRCPTPEELIEERYLDEAYARNIERDTEIRCEDGEIDVIWPGRPGATLRAQWKRRACRTLRLGTEAWALPFRGLIWAWQTAARLFV